jgi:hypothetical protein
LISRIARFAAIFVLGYAFSLDAASASSTEFAGSDDTIVRALSRYAGAHRFVELPLLANEDLEALAKGGVVMRVHARHDDAGVDDAVGAQAFGFQVIDAPRLHTWIALLGGPGSGSEGRFTRAMLERMPVGAYVRYQHVDLPWPFQNRHWAIHCEKNLAIARQSDGLIWEHHWSLHPHGEAMVHSAVSKGLLPATLRDKLESAIYLPANRGAWILFDLGHGRTLVVAYVDVGLGGRVPETLVRTFAQRQLRSGFDAIRGNSARAYDQYRADPVVHDGFGLPIPAVDRQVNEPARRAPVAKDSHRGARSRRDAPLGLQSESAAD